LIVTTGDFFVRNEDDYYFVEINYPYFLMHWTDMNITSGLAVSNGIYNDLTQQQTNNRPFGRKTRN
jgi:hypothetical protein